MDFLRVFLFCAAAIILITLVSLRRAHIRVEYSVSWLGVGAALLICALFPKWPLRAAAGLGLNPQVAFILLAGALISALIFEISIEVSRLRDENVMLTQRLAILEYHLNQRQTDHGVKTNPDSIA